MANSARVRCVPAVLAALGAGAQGVADEAVGPLRIKLAGRNGAAIVSDHERQGTGFHFKPKFQGNMRQKPAFLAITLAGQSISCGRIASAQVLVDII